MAGKFFATNFTLEFVLRQMLRPMLLHLFHRIETLPTLWTLDFVEIDERIAQGEGQGQRVLIVSQLIVVEHFRTTQLDFTILECRLQRVEHGTRLTPGNSHPSGQRCGADSEYITAAMKIMVLVEVGAPPGRRSALPLPAWSTRCEGDGTGRGAYGARYFFRFSRLLCFLSGERVTYRRHNTTHLDTRGHMRATPDAALLVRPFLTPPALCGPAYNVTYRANTRATLPGGVVCFYDVVGYRLPVNLVIW